MMIGPEPITRMRCRSARRGMNEIVDDVGASVSRPPASNALELRRRADERGYVNAAHERRIGGNLGGDADSQQDFSCQFPSAHAIAATDVVDLTGNAPRCKEEIGFDHVRDVKIVPYGILVPEDEGLLVDAA